MLVGVSRKTFLGTLLAGPDGTPRPAALRDDASLALITVLAQRSVWGVRVHSVRATRDAIAVVSRLGQIDKVTVAPRGADPAGGDGMAAGTLTPTATGRVALRGIAGFGHHGVFDFEREQGQTFVVDVVCTVDLDQAAATDDLTWTVDYGVLAQAVVADIQGTPLNLIEALPTELRIMSLVRRGRGRSHRAQAAGADAGHCGRRRRNADPSRSFCPCQPGPRRPEKLNTPHQAKVDGMSSPNPYAIDADTLSGMKPLRKVVYSVGSNLGDRLGNLQGAVDAISDTPDVIVVDISSVYETEPIGGPADNPKFLNLVIVAKTTLEPRTLLERAFAVEDVGAYEAGSAGGRAPSTWT